MPAPRVLVLGGTGEGRELAEALAAEGLAVISSLAGRVANPRLPTGQVRIGGFGGADGLRDYLRREQIRAVVDATHPFAARITANAVLACSAAGESGTGEPVGLMLLRRPAWIPGPQDRWTPVPDLAAAAARIAARPSRTRVLLTTGRQETAVFAPLPQRFWLRAVEPPDGPLPQHCAVVLDRGPFTLDTERDLFTRHRIELLVTKNSGGPMTSAKLAVAAELGVEVIMVERPAPPAGIPTAADVRTVLAWLRRTL